MTLSEVLDNVRNKTGWYLQNGFENKFDNGTTSCVYKLLKTKRHRIPIAFVQVRYYNPEEVISATMIKTGGEEVELI